MSTQTHKYRVIALDVWGHGPDEHEKYDCDGECDGYTVNDAHYCGAIEVTAQPHLFNEGKEGQFCVWEASDAEILRACIEAGYLKDICKPETVEIDGENDYTLFLNWKEDGCPLIQLERVQCTCGFDTKPSYSAHDHHESCPVKKR